MSPAVIPLFIAPHWAEVNELLFSVYSYAQLLSPSLYLNRRYSSMMGSPVTGSVLLFIETST